MSNQLLIPVFNGTLQNQSTQLVDARLLYEFLEVTSRFNDWITNRIKEYEFVEGQDFILITKNLVTKTRGGDRRSKDYHISLDMAKELSMIERTEKGRQARKYFIECERRLQQGGIRNVDHLLEHSRFLLVFDSELKATLKQVPFNYCMLDPDSPQELLRLVNSWVPIKLLPDLVKAGIDRLAGKATYQVI